MNVVSMWDQETSKCLSWCFGFNFFSQSTFVCETEIVNSLAPTSSACCWLKASVFCQWGALGFATRHLWCVQVKLVLKWFPKWSGPKYSHLFIFTLHKLAYRLKIQNNTQACLNITKHKDKSSFQVINAFSERQMWSLCSSITMDAKFLCAWRSHACR